MSIKDSTVIENLKVAGKEKDLISFLNKLDYLALYSRYKENFKKFTFEHTRSECIEILNEIISSWSIDYLISSLPDLNKKEYSGIDTYWTSIKNKGPMMRELEAYLQTLPHKYQYYIGWKNIKEEDFIQEIDFNIANDYVLQGISKNISEINLSPSNKYGVYYQYLDIFEKNGFKKGKNLSLRGIFLGYLPYEKDASLLEEEVNNILALMILVDIFRINKTNRLSELQKFVYFDEKEKMREKTLSAETSTLLQNTEINQYLQYLSPELINEFFNNKGEIKQKSLNQRIEETIIIHKELFEKIIDPNNTQNEILIFRNLLNIYTQILGTNKRNIKYILLVSLLENLVKLNGSFSPNLSVEMDTVNMIICNKKGSTLKDKVEIKEAIECVYHERNNLVHQAKSKEKTDASYYKVLFIATSLMQDFIKVIK